MHNQQSAFPAFPVFCFWLSILNPQLFVQLLMGRLLLRPPRPAFIHKPMFGNSRAADLRLPASLLQSLVITIADCFVAVFYPEARSVYCIGELCRLVLEKAASSRAYRAC